MKYINDIPILLIMITLASYIPFRFLYLKKYELNLKLSKEITYMVMIAYAESLLYLTLFPTSGAPLNEVKSNLIPFQTINLYMHYHDNISLQVINLLGNVIIFVPIGIFALLLLKEATFPKVLLIGFCSTLFIESMQLVLSINGIISRSFDVDDLILNTIGVLIGYVIGILLQKFIPNKKESE